MQCLFILFIYVVKLESKAFENEEGKKMSVTWCAESEKFNSTFVYND